MEKADSEAIEGTQDVQRDREYPRGFEDATENECLSPKQKRIVDLTVTPPVSEGEF